MKKIYEMPLMRAYEVKIEHTLLVGSDPDDDQPEGQIKNMKEKTFEWNINPIQ